MIKLQTKITFMKLKRHKKLFNKLFLSQIR